MMKLKGGVRTKMSGDEATDKESLRAEDTALVLETAAISASDEDAAGEAHSEAHSENGLQNAPQASGRASPSPAASSTR